MARTIAITALALLGLVACASAPRVGGVRVVTNVPDATLYVDEELRGPVQAYEQSYVRLQPGEHRLMIEHPDYFTEYVEVDVAENMAMAVTVELRRRPE